MVERYKGVGLTITTHLLSGWPKKSPNFIFATKMVFPKSLKFMNSGSETIVRPSRAAYSNGPNSAFGIRVFGGRSATAACGACGRPGPVEGPLRLGHGLKPAAHRWPA